MAANDKKTAEELRQKLEYQQKHLISWLKSESGEQGLDFLVRKYGGDVVEVDPYQTHIRIGERRVIDYLLALKKEDGNGF